MSTNTEIIQELCDSNGFIYQPENNKVLIDDQFWFYINNPDDLYYFLTYIDIINGRNGMVNAICEKLNTTPKQGCNFKRFEFHQNEMICIDNCDTCFTIDINNVANTVGYTKYDKFINFRISIKLSNPLEYYLIGTAQTKSYILKYKLKSLIDIKDVLNQLCTFEKKKCDRESCPNMVDIGKEFPNPYGLCLDTSEYMLHTAHGYRNKASSFPKYYFCSKECMDWFDKYKRCRRCYEGINAGADGTYIEELGYTLCNGRGDCNPACITKYNLEQRFKQDYANYGFYEIDRDLKRVLLRDCDELEQIITDNGNKITYQMLMDIICLKENFEVRERPGAEPGDKASFKEQCDNIKAEYGLN